MRDDDESFRTRHESRKPAEVRHALGLKAGTEQADTEDCIDIELIDTEERADNELVDNNQTDQEEDTD